MRALIRYQVWKSRIVINLNIVNSVGTFPKLLHDCYLILTCSFQVMNMKIRLFAYRSSKEKAT